jgi:hypothetical protein
MFLFLIIERALLNAFMPVLPVIGIDNSDIDANCKAPIFFIHFHLPDATSLNHDTYI